MQDVKSLRLNSSGTEMSLGQVNSLKSIQMIFPLMKWATFMAT